MINSIITWLQNLIDTIGPIGIAVATFIESFFAPIPSELILFGAGTIVESNGELIIYIICATIGSYLGTLPFYFIGAKSRKYVYKFFERYGKYLFITVDEIQNSEQVFKKYGKTITFFGRLIPMVRSLISIPAGISKMNFGVYSVFTILGSSIWNTILITLGYLFKDHQETVMMYVEEYERDILIIVAFVAIIYAVYLGQKKYRKLKANESE